MASDPMEQPEYVVIKWRTVDDEGRWTGTHERLETVHTTVGETIVQWEERFERGAELVSVEAIKERR